MGVPGDRHHLRMEICRKVNGSTHANITASMHHDAQVRDEVSR
jgi:hypothetical protein